MESTNVESQQPLLRDATETSSLLKQEAAPQSSFHTGSKRTCRDSIFAFLFLTAILTTFAFGIIASTRTDTLNLDTKLRLSNYNATTHKCEITQEQAPKASDSDPDSDSAFVKLVALASLSAFGLTIPLSLVLVFFLRRYPHALVAVSAPFVSLLLLVSGLLGGLLWFSRCLSVPREVWSEVLGSKEISDSVLALLTPVVCGYLTWKSWTRSSMENGVEVMRTATAFLKEHFVLLVVNPMLLAGAMVLVNKPIFTFMWYAFNVGDIVPDFDVVNDPIHGCGLGTGIWCCREERPMWVYAYITFASITTVWVFMVSMVLQHSVVSGTVSLWYFSPEGSSAVGNVKRSLRNAYGPSFGAACNLGTMVTTMIVTLVRFSKKKLSDKMLKSRGLGMMSESIRVQRYFSWMSRFPEHYPQLPSIFLGISESHSKKSHQDLMQQTLPISTGMSNFHDLLSHAIWGDFVTGTLLIIFPGPLEALDYSNAYVLITFAYCFPTLVTGLATGFFLAVFSVTKSVSVCHALEREFGEISEPEVPPEVCQEIVITAPSLLENGAQVAERAS